MTVSIDRRLNLVIPIEQGESTLYAYSMPIGREVFEKYFRTFSKTFAALYAEGGALTGPRLAAMYLRSVAEDAGNWEGENGVEAGLMAEILRLTTVVMPDGGVWKSVQYADAKARKLLSEDDLSEVENAIVFFTLVSHMHKRSEQMAHLSIMSTYWGAQITSSNLSEFRSSLPTLTATEITPPMAKLSSIAR